jgi:FHA domain
LNGEHEVDPVRKVLVVHDGKRERELLLVERLVVGRDPACHAEFVAAASAVTVRDLGSRNGIFVNGTRRAEQALKPGDVVQIGPLRVRYLRDRVAAPGPPSPADLDGTQMIPAAPARGESVLASPPSSIDVFRRTLPDDALETFDDGEGETRVGGTGAFSQAMKAAADAGDDATGFTPTPRPAPMPLVAVGIPSEPPVIAAQTAHAPALGSFVLIQLGTLAIIVFVATVAPLVLSRGTVLSAIDEGSVTALLVWPVLPLLIGLAATLVIANVIIRRVMDALAASRGNVEGR